MKVDFHILKQNQDHCLLYLSRLVEKAYLAGHCLHIAVPSNDMAMHIDNLLWTFKDTSFLPHHILENNPSPVRIVISTSKTLPEKTDVLINLNPHILEDFRRCARIIELVFSDESVQIAGRQKYRQYQTFGCTLQTFHINL